MKCFKNFIFLLVIASIGVAHASGSTTILAHFDIEADGPTVLRNNMLSFAATFTDVHGKEISTFLGDLQPLLGHEPEAKTMEWWNSSASNRKELARIQSNARPPMQVMADLAKRLDELTLIRNEDGSVSRKRVIWIARPASYDFSWLYAYYQDFLRTIPSEVMASKHAPMAMHFSATCVSTMRDVYQLIHGLDRKAMDALVKEWTQGTAITHNPLDDARYQARLFFALARELGIDTSKL